MGFAIKTLSDVVRNMDDIQRILNPKAYAFVLYKKEHEDLRKYVLDNFNKLHEISHDTVLFILDKPEQWLARNDIEYYRKTVGENYIPGHDDVEVKVAAKYFEIPEEKLPAIVLFYSLQNSEWVIFSLKGISKDIYDFIFRNLFEQLNEVENIFQIEKSDLLHALNSMAHSIEYSRFKIDIHQLLPNFILKTKNNRVGEEDIKEKLNKMSEDMKKFHEEINQNFKILSDKLSLIYRELKTFKDILRPKLEKLQKQKESPLAEFQYEKLLFQCDERLWTSSVRIAEESEEVADTAIYNLSFLENMEKESIEMILSGLTVYQIARKVNSANFDFSLAAVGLWKAVEKELNIILIDTLRLIRNFISAIPSYGIADKPGRCEIFAGYKKGTEYNVDINHQFERKFSPVMFGDMIKISENWDKNDYFTIIEKIKNEMKIVSGMNIFMTSFVDRFKKIVYDYRNACSHTEKMSEAQFTEFKDILMSAEGLYYQISELKKTIFKVFSNNAISPEHRGITAKSN